MIPGAAGTRRLARPMPTDARRRGWCPGLARPMPTGDGLLARLHPPCGILAPGQLRAVAEAARRFGNGGIDVTNRANLQVRGVSEAGAPALAAVLTAAGLGDRRADAGPQRLTLTSPLAGLAPERFDALALARAIEALGLAVRGLPPKLLVAIEGGGADGLAGAEADLHLRPAVEGVALGLAGPDGPDWVGACPLADAPGIVAALLATLVPTGARRLRDLSESARAALAAAAGLPGRAPVPPPAGPMRAPSLLVLAGGLSALAVEAPFGRCTAADLDALAEAADALGCGDIRLAPTRGFVLAGRGDAGAVRARLAARGFVVAADDPRRAVAACPGAPACASGTTATAQDAARLADAFRPFAARGLRAHVSGCAKGCAHPGVADLTLVGMGGRYGLVLGGAPGDTPSQTLPFEAVLERVRGSADLADALSPIA